MEWTLLWQWGKGVQAPAGTIAATAGWKYREGSCGSRHYCGSAEIQRKLVLEWTLLRQWGNGEKGSCGSGHYCGSVEIQGNSCWSGHYYGSVEIQGRHGKQKRLLQEQMLLQQCGNVEKAPAGADTAAAVWKYREGSCGSGHCCGSVGV
ncbi:hypothetical protein ROHU_020314 [Labeo rohita]|uniref:Uncharacterized protein n=1 Tax=Labeo rohita TaxID=84645 RepID=A0A498N644_LABRO|nr:hypothetical protein ROHU_020314 [Labeo rohita]